MTQGLTEARVSTRVGGSRLIVNADDFGRSVSINEAVIRAHREGILTTASLMVNEPASDHAVEQARRNPGLGVGLHLTLLCGASALAPERIPGLVDSHGRFPDNPLKAGLVYYFRRGLREQLRAEIHAQFERFNATGLPLDHLNGHLHLHLHPVVLEILLRDAARLGCKHLRLTFDPLGLNLRLASGRWLYRLSHTAVFHLLAARSRAAFHRAGFKHTDRVFGLLQNGEVHEAYVLRLLERLPRGDSELYSHPSLDEFRPEFEALISSRVRERVAALGIQLIRYADL